jgi:uncharacterized protein YceH (UPF0502 family)
MRETRGPRFECPLLTSLKLVVLIEPAVVSIELLKSVQTPNEVETRTEKFESVR